MSRSRSSVASDDHGRLEPRLLRAAGSDHVEALKEVVESARENGQFSDNFLRIGLMRSAERGCINATQYLLSIGAKTDVSGNRLSPLLRAVEHNHVRIVQLLLDYGASPEITDKDGRTALMTAAWKNHWHVLQVLISRGANVNARDLKRRNVLHNLAADKQCDWGDDVIDLLLRTNCHLDGPEGQDVLGRTPLHWACATGKLRLAELFLTRPCGEKPDVNAVELRNKTALHIAAAHGRDDMVQLLLRHGADVNARSDGGWSPLHNACDQGSEPIVRLLLQAGAHINSQLLNGVTPLHLAAQAGHREVVECLLERPDLKRRIRDNFGSTAFLRAAQFKRKDIVLLLAPFNNVEALSADAIGACKAFEATIVDFGNFHNENRVKRASVYDLLYGRDSQNPRKQAFTTIPADSKATEFRWIHLPANNMAWVEALLTKSFIEEGAHDVDGFKGLEKSFNYQHRGQRVHSHFMRPLCQNTPRTSGLCEEDSSDAKADEPVPSITINGLSADGKQSQPQPGKGPKQAHKAHGGKLERQDTPPQQDDGSKSHTKKGKSTGKQGKSGGSATPKSEPKSRPYLTLHDRNRSPSLSRESSQAAGSNICVFMPYLHFETVERRQRMQEAIQQAETLTLQPPGLVRKPTRDEMLIRAHVNSSTASLHVRRTLDQFFYPNIDTKTRDQDQVVYRYQTKWNEREQSRQDPKIFMVDQLWMWILGKNLIVTSFPQRWDQPRNDPLNVLDGIIEDVNSKTRDPVRSVFDLALIITNRCSGVFDRHRMGDEEYQFLDMFEASIGIATDRETMLFRDFNLASAQASDWLRYRRRLGRLTRSFRSVGRNSQEETFGDGQDPEDDSWLRDNEYEQPLFVDQLLNIGQETDLLAEAKDIRDELNMIRTVLQHQQHVLFDMQEVVCEIYQGQHRSQHEVKKRFKEQQRTIDMHLKDIDRMDNQAKRIYSSMTDLLDLKQRHANCLEARFARDQAAGTTRQGKTIMMFTIVTIIFLPLSFITSIFTINIDEFPHSGLSLSYVAKYTFGIGFSISIPLILLALSVDDIGGAARVAMRYLRQWLARHPSKPSTRTEEVLSSQQQQHQQPASALEKILSASRTRRSIDTDYTGDVLLPVSTRGTTGRRGSARSTRIGFANGGTRKSFSCQNAREVDGDS